MNPPNISTIIFDFGGVFLSNDDIQEIGRYLAQKYQVDPKGLNDTILEVWFKARIDPSYDASFWNQVSQKLHISSQQVIDEFVAYPQPIPEMISFVHDLNAQKRYKIALLSNQIFSWHTRLMQKYELSELFSPIITSYEEHVAKPNEQIYKNLLSKLSVLPSECLFIDDREYNLKPAEELGIHTLLFTSYPALMKDFAMLGLTL